MFQLPQSECPCMESYCIFCVRCRSASIFTVLERVELSIWTKNSESSEVIRNWKSSPSFTITHFFSSLLKQWREVFQLYLSFISTSCFCLHEYQFEDHRNSHFCFRSSQLVSWNIFIQITEIPYNIEKSSALINPLTFLFNLLPIAQIQGQILFIVTLTEDLNNLIKIKETVILSPALPIPEAFRDLKQRRRPCPSKMGHQDSASCQQTQDSAVRGRSVFMEGASNFLLSLEFLHWFLTSFLLA